MNDPFARFDALVQELERDPRDGPEQATARPRRSVRASARVWAFRALLLAAALVLPFYILVGVSVLLYRYQGVPTWLALLAAVLLTFLILLLYASRVAKRISGKRRVPSSVSKAMLAVVGAYAVYALLYLSGLNVKNEDLRSEYRSLHPLLRVATSTFILVDGDLVITDMERQAADYEQMRLPVYERSLHFVQEDGYAHAVDLRTIGRSEWRNFIMQVYFKAMGFRILRHVGTADHLHVSLPLPD
jgi:hypothetical protein